MIIDQQQIRLMEKRYRATFINSLSGYKSLQMVGTVSDEGISNIALFSSIFHLGANPALIGMVVRPQTPNHDTLTNIKSTGVYTLNNVLPDWYERAHQTSTNYSSGVSEFKECGFDEYYIDEFEAPFIYQSTVKIGLNVKEIMPLSINESTIVIGEISCVVVAEELLGFDGYLDHTLAGTVTVAGLDGYFSTESLGRLTYAKKEIS